MKKKILISTGGSGGHVMPAITIYDHLKNHSDVMISTDLRGFKYLNDGKYKIFLINTPRLNRLILMPFSILVVFFLTLKSLFLLIFLIYLIIYFPRFDYIQSRVFSFFNRDVGTHNF